MAVVNVGVQLLARRAEYEAAAVRADEHLNVHAQEQGPAAHGIAKSH